MNKELQIVSFDVPYPPNYGGVIDVFYKLKAIFELGIDIYLHTFQYGREASEVLEKYCKKVYYYKRYPFLPSLFSVLPFRVKSRSSNKLIYNLKQIKAPILFEGLHSTHSLHKTNFEQKILVRTHNIEHLYYLGLKKSEKSVFKKFFYELEGIKFKKYEKTLKKADKILTISPAEHNYFSENYGEKSIYIPAFHGYKSVKQLSEKGKNTLYHGDLRISDNIKSALSLIEVFKNTDINFVVASSFKNKKILFEINKHDNIGFQSIENKNDLIKLLEEAHVNVLSTFQKTGIKLKLLNALYCGRFCVANTKMIEDTGLESLCELANTKQEFLEKTKALYIKNFTKEITDLRNEKLREFSSSVNAKKIIELL